jgi:SpoVK/Ycf46/Vps4 family AAA+-type ATPase
MNHPDANDPAGGLDEKTLRLLEKALMVSPDDWETRSHLLSHFLASNQIPKAHALLLAAPKAPETEAGALVKARVEAEVNPADAIRTLQEILQHNRACAQAYLQLARIYRKQGLVEEARKKYGAATVIDDTLVDPEWEAWLGNGAPPVRRETARPVAAGAAEDDPAVSPEEIIEAMNKLAEPAALSRPKTTFNDIGGMGEVIERIRINIIYPFKNPGVFQKFNRNPGGGILLYGPPGCGKTHIARATAGECDATFIPIAITDVLSKWLGESERHLHDIFETARRRAPSVIFIDEIDALGMNRSDASASMAPLVNVLLSEMDGVSADNKNVMVLGATNAPWRVDSALRRPGRFDRVVFVPPPDEPARAAILAIHLRDMPTETLDLAKVARLTEKFSGADLRSLVSRASEQAILAEMKSGLGTKLTQKMLMDATKDQRPSTVEWLETARNYASYANRAGLYDDLVAYFESQ